MHLMYLNLWILETKDLENAKLRFNISRSRENDDNDSDDGPMGF